MTAAAGAIVQQTLGEQVHTRLMSALIGGDYVAGDRLVMDRLAETFGVSRTPVRDALARLEQDGLVVPASRGYEVRAVTEADIDAIYQARIAVEGHSARLVADLGGDALVGPQRAVEATRGTDMADPVAAFWANRDVHRAIVAATGNQVLARCFDAVWNSSVSAFAFGQIHRTASTGSDVASQHSELLDVLASGDPDQAQVAMVDHLVAGRHRIGY